MAKIRITQEGKRVLDPHPQNIKPGDLWLDTSDGRVYNVEPDSSLTYATRLDHPDPVECDCWHPVLLGAGVAVATLIVIIYIVDRFFNPFR